MNTAELEQALATEKELHDQSLLLLGGIGGELMAIGSWINLALAGDVRMVSGAAILTTIRSSVDEIENHIRKSATHDASQ